MSAHQIMSADEMRRAIVRIGHEIIERQGGASHLALVGIERRGPALARRIATVIEAQVGVVAPVIALDVTPYRDDRGGAIDPDATAAIPSPTLRPYDPALTTVILVDDVLKTGRTVRAAIDALLALGRPAAVRLAVLIDRGHRELPIRADFVGLSVPTSWRDSVEVRVAETDGNDEVIVREDP